MYIFLVELLIKTDEILSEIDDIKIKVNNNNIYIKNEKKYIEIMLKLVYCHHMIYIVKNSMKNTKIYL